jgi:hypothetical protein
MFRRKSVTALQSFRVNSHSAFRYPGVQGKYKAPRPLINVER